MIGAIRRGIAEGATVACPPSCLGYKPFDLVTGPFDNRSKDRKATAHHPNGGFDRGPDGHGNQVPGGILKHEGVNRVEAKEAHDRGTNIQ